MNNKTQSADQEHPANPTYAWLEQTRQRLLQMTGSADADILQNIIDDGLSRLESLPAGDPLLAGCIHLSVAEAQVNLALSQENQAQRLAGLVESRRSCEKATELTLTSTCGTACLLLPQAITLLAALYKAAPQMHQAGLAESLQLLAYQLDQKLLEQKFLRQHALGSLQTARMLLASGEGLSPADKRLLYSQAASQMLDAGEFYLEAGDQDMLLRVQADLEALQKSLIDPAVPLPQLALFAAPLQEELLLPPLSTQVDIESRHYPAQEDEQESTQAYAQTIPPPPAGRRTSPLRWVFSIAGLMMSCLMIMCSIISLFSTFTAKPATPTLDVSFYLAQTEIASRQIALALTSTVLAAPSQSLQSGSGYASQPTLTSQPSAAPTGTLTPALKQPTDTVQPTSNVEAASTPTLTGGQELSDFRIFDDFSSDALEWPVFDDGRTIINYQDGAYRFQVADPGYYDWVYFPVEFIPYEMEFDVQGPAGNQGGTFGIFCHFQDEQNYYYVEFNLQNNTYLIGEYSNNQSIHLSEPGSAGQDWRGAPMLKSPPTSTNHIGIGCYLNEIALFINDEYVDLVTVKEPFENPGKAAFFVYSQTYAGQDGYTVIFDNAEIYQPVQ